MTRIENPFHQPVNGYESIHNLLLLCFRFCFYYFFSCYSKVERQCRFRDCNRVINRVDMRHHDELFHIRTRMSWQQKPSNSPVYFPNGWLCSLLIIADEDSIRSNPGCTELAQFFFYFFNLMDLYNGFSLKTVPTRCILWEIDAIISIKLVAWIWQLNSRV